MINLSEFSRSTALTAAKIQAASNRLKLGDLGGGGKRDMISTLHRKAKVANISPGAFADALAYGLYRADIEHHFPTLPASLRGELRRAGLD